MTHDTVSRRSSKATVGEGVGGQPSADFGRPLDARRSRSALQAAGSANYLRGRGCQVTFICQCAGRSVATGARLPAPFARRAALSLSLCRNRRLRGGLKYPAQPVVFRQSLSARLRCLLGDCCSRKAQADQTDCNDAEDLRKERHGESRRPTGALSLVCTGRRYVTGHLSCRPGEAARCLTSDPLWFCVYIGVRCIPAGNVPLLT
jgi:hypothetical protein